MVEAWRQIRLRIEEREAAGRASQARASEDEIPSRVFVRLGWVLTFFGMGPKTIRTDPAPTARHPILERIVSAVDFDAIGCRATCAAAEGDAMAEAILNIGMPADPVFDETPRGPSR